MSKKVVFSIIIPTLNAGSTLGMCLSAIRDQDIDQGLVEIIVADGGSTDNTVEIAKKFGAKVIFNEKRKPEWAEYLALNVARGDYAVIMGADEIILSKKALSERLNMFLKTDVRNIVTSGLLTPPGYAKICRYINSLGDPFNYFIYRVDGENYLNSLTNKYNSKSYFQGKIIEFKDSDILPIVDGAHTFDLKYLKEIHQEITPEVIPVIFWSMASKTKRLGVLKNDFTNHYSTSSFRTLIKKTKFKLVGNIFYSESPSVGYRNRERVSKKLIYKKYLFLLYAASIVWPLIDSMAISVRKRDLIFLNNFILTEFILFYTVYLYTLKFLKINKNWGDYGQ